MLTIEEAQNHPLWNEQIELETEMRSLGIDRFRKAVENAREKGQETRTAPVRRLMVVAHEQVLEGLREFYAEVEAKKAGRKHSAYTYLKAIDNDDVVAHLTCRIILDTVVQRPTLTHLSVMIAEALEDEVNYAHFEEVHKPGFLKAAGRAKRTTNEKFRRKSVLSTATKLGVELIDWPKRDMVLFGSKLVEIFLEKTGLIGMVKRQDNLALEMKPEHREWIEEECRRSEWLSPMYLPMVIPPQPWSTPKAGGYWSGRARRLTLVKSNNRAYLEELGNQDMPEVYTAVNALQNTAWAVNRKVLAVMEELCDNHSTLAIIPQFDDQPLPEKPLWLVEGMKKENMTEDQLAQFIAWKGECARIHEENNTMTSKRISFSRMLWVANKFKDREFYYPHQLDWRGRAYPTALYLQPQGNDAQRGLLEFSSLCPINTQEAADWLAIHGAGLWGVDKVSFAERVQWINDHEAQILACAEDPYSNRFWAEGDHQTKVEKPWSALAFCFEWAGFRAHGFGYESALPVQMDGTCNGLQNFSAMLNDEIGGSAVNLVPSEKPQDIYMQVADLVIARVNREAAEGNELAAMWVGNVVRKVVKRPVMTLAYGARKYGFTNMIMEDTIKPWKKDKPATFPFGTQSFPAAQYLGALIWDAVGEVVVAARSAMDWLQEVARVVSSEKLPINWQTPTGFLVQQNYKLRDMKMIQLAFQSVRLAPRIDVGSDKLDAKKQASGISPNWVHSLDASHMTRTICASTIAGVECFSFIHDSYGTHAGNCPALAAILREEFVRMYSEQCVLTRFKDDLQTMLPEGVVLPELPPKGSLDLSLVLDSAFFFA